MIAVCNSEERLMQTIADLEAIDDWYSIVLKNADIGILDWPLDSNRLYLSPSFKNILGYQDAQFAETFDELIQHVQLDERNRFELEIQSAIEDGTEKFQALFPLTHRGGYRAWFLFRLRVLRSDDGTPTRLVGVAMDITEIKNELVVPPTV